MQRVNLTNNLHIKTNITTNNQHKLSTSKDLEMLNYLFLSLKKVHLIFEEFLQNCNLQIIVLHDAQIMLTRRFTKQRPNLFYFLF